MCCLCKMSVMISCPSQSPLGVTDEKLERIRYCSGDLIFKNFTVNCICYALLKTLFNFVLFKVLSLPYSPLKGNKEYCEKWKPQSTFFKECLWLHPGVDSVFHT